LRKIALIVNDMGSINVDADRIYREFLSDLKHKKEQRDALADNPEVRENWDSRYGDRENQVVFIGKGYNKESIRTELEKCLD